MANASRPRYFHLGVRLDAVERIRGGRTTVEECARDLHADTEMVRAWLVRHGDDRPTSFGEIVQTSERFVLRQRVERLRDYLARTERELTQLHKQLIAALA